jgi:predicted Rossmann-fold nucleotide-binding protein
MELFLVATLNNIKNTNKKIIIWNIDNYYNLLIDFINSEQFQQGDSTKTLNYNNIIICDTYEDVLYNIIN